MTLSEPNPSVMLRAAGISPPYAGRLSHSIANVARETATYGWDRGPLAELVQGHGAQTTGRLGTAQIGGPQGDSRRAITLWLRWVPEPDRDPVSATFRSLGDGAAGEVYLTGPLPAVLFCVCARAESIGAWNADLAAWVERALRPGAPATHAWRGLCVIDLGHAR